MIESFPKANSASPENERPVSAHEAQAPNAHDIEPVAKELEKRLAEIEPEFTDELSPDKADRLNRTLKDIGAI